MVIRKPDIVPLLIIILAILLILAFLESPRIISFIENILNSKLIIAIIDIVLFICIVICIVTILLTDSDYVLTVCIIALIISSILLLTTFPRLARDIGEYISNVFSDMIKQLLGS